MLWLVILPTLLSIKWIWVKHRELFIGLSLSPLLQSKATLISELYITNLASSFVSTNPFSSTELNLQPKKSTKARLGNTKLSHSWAPSSVWLELLWLVAPRVLTPPFCGHYCQAGFCWCCSSTCSENIEQPPPGWLPMMLFSNHGPDRCCHRLRAISAIVLGMPPHWANEPHQKLAKNSVGGHWLLPSFHSTHQELLHFGISSPPLLVSSFPPTVSRPLYAYTSHLLSPVHQGWPLTIRYSDPSPLQRFIVCSRKFHDVLDVLPAVVVVDKGGPRDTLVFVLQSARPKLFILYEEQSAYAWSWWRAVSLRHGPWKEHKSTWTFWKRLLLCSYCL